MSNTIISGVISILPLFIKGSDDLVKSIKADIESGGSIENIEETIKAGVHVIENYTSDLWDKALEQFLVVLREAIVLEQDIADALNPEPTT